MKNSMKQIHKKIKCARRKINHIHKKILLASVVTIIFLIIGSVDASDGVNMEQFSLGFIPPEVVDLGPPTTQADSGTQQTSAETVPGETENMTENTTANTSAYAPYATESGSPESTPNIEDTSGVNENVGTTNNTQDSSTGTQENTQTTSNTETPNTNQTQATQTQETSQNTYNGGWGGGGYVSPSPDTQQTQDTQPTQDTTAPTITSVTPVNGNSNVNIAASITANFSEAMDPSTINADTFIIYGIDAAPISGAITYEGTTATFRPTINLNYNTSYTAVISASAKDVVGNPMSGDYTWHFSAPVAPDTTPPRIIATIPVHASTDVGVNSQITVDFNEEMDPSTITTATFILYAPNGSPVVGVVHYTGNTATFTPSAPLDFDSTYTAMISKNAKDVAGNALEGNYIMSFTTVTLPI
jgi:hypothetical protein